MKKLLLYLLILFPFFYLTSSIFHHSSFINLKSAILNLQSTMLYAYPPGWSDDILLTPEDDMQRSNPDLDVDTYNNVWAVWDSVFWGDGYVYYTKRDSLGNCIIPETTVSNNVSKSWMSRIVIDNSNNAQFIWRDESPQGDGVWHAKLANDGTVIVSSHLAVAGAGGGSSTLLPEMVLNKYQEINIIWDERPSSYNQMNYTKLDTLGNPVITKIQVSPVGLDAYWVGIGVDSFANNHLACRTDSSATGDRLTYSKLDKDGNILISNKVLATGGNNSIVSDKNQNIHMVYTAPGTIIEYLKLDQDGNILIGPDTISLPEFTSNTYAHMAIDSLQFLHVVWQAYQYDVFYIMYCKLDTMGNFVIPPMKIVHPPYTNGAGEPRIAVDCSNHLHVVWKDIRLGGLDIFYKRGKNVGIEETTQLKTVGLPGISVSPNPFSKMTKISFGKEQGAKSIGLKIYDATGRVVRSFPIINLCNPNKSVVSVYWTGTDNIGNHLPAGVYFICLSNFTDAQSVPVVLLKN